MQFDSPFLIVYIGTSLFSVFLPMRLCYERSGRWFKHLCCCRHEEVGIEENDIIIIPWGNDVQLLRSRREEGFHDIGGDNLTLMPSQQNRNDDVDHDDYSFDPTNAVQMQATERQFTNESSHHYEPNSPDNNTKYLYSHQDHISMAMKVAPLWFLSNYFYAISLEWTSIASSTVLASMGSLFAFGFATCSKYGDEQITKFKLLGVLLCFMGGVATTYTDAAKSTDPNLVSEALDITRYLRHQPSNTNDSSIRSLWGDLAGLVSAIGYGAYTVLLRHLCPKDEKRMSMQLFFGYVGLLNMAILLPIAIWVVLSSPDDDSSNQSSTENEDTSNTDDDEMKSIHSTLTWPIFLFLILKGLLDNVLSDYLWARAVILTSATVASVSVGLTIPMAFVADIIMANNDAHGTGQVLGAVLVLFGFVFVNIDGVGGKRGTQEGADGEIEFENSDDFDTGRVRDVEILA